jgi:hypothetical protein
MLVAYSLLAVCLVYNSILKMEVTFSTETSVVSEYLFCL